LDLIARLGTLYLPEPSLCAAAQLRLRAGPASYSICGVTHTTASHGAMEAITGLMTAPVMPWDALVCTSQAVSATIAMLIEREHEYLRWRFGQPLRSMLPQLPVIPLGVHTADFQFTPAERAAARRVLEIGEEEVVALFLGRLSFHAKAHPHPMYLGLQRTAERTAKKITLIQCGWFYNAPIEAAFRDGAARTCPDVRVLFTDGKEAKARRQSWAAADLFISLSDNIQETFGLSPIEAMAAGLPLIVTDWDGYRDTVRDGVDGFRIPTWMPSPGLGAHFAASYEADAVNYDLYCGLTCQTISLDLGALTEHLSSLICDPELRRRLGEAGRRRARELFDWAVVYRKYQSLWAELEAIRRAARQDTGYQDLLQEAPRSAPARPDPFAGFAGYPTAPIEARTLVSLAPRAENDTYRALLKHPLFDYAARSLPAPDLADAVLNSLRSEAQTVNALGIGLGLDLGTATRAIAVLAKMGLVELSSDEG